MTSTTTGRRRGALAVVLASLTAAVAAPASVGAPRERPPGAPAGPWQLVYSESFGEPVDTEAVAWVRDPHGDDSPWDVDHLDDDGRFFHVKGGQDFRRHLAASDVLRKRVQLGKDGWLTLELAARDYAKDGRPDRPPRLERVTGKGGARARLVEPSHDGGIILRSTRPLPSRYRIEYTLRAVDFGGKRDGSWTYDGKVNGYDPTGTKTNWPWKRSGSWEGPASPDNPAFGDVRAENGFYLLSIMDYANPAPHNNVFIHNHRKVGMDMYNVSGSWARAYQVCNPATGELIPYPQSTANGINAIFFDGSRFRSPEIGYNQFVMETECGTRDGADPAATIVSAAEIRPEVLPDEPYRFAIERDATGYAMEMTGTFKHVGHTTLRYHRAFVQDGRPIWHYNQTPQEYDGQLDTTLPFSGPHGSYTVDQWPKGSAYPDTFIIGDPHINYYEGTAEIDDLRLYVPRTEARGHVR